MKGFIRRRGDAWGVACLLGHRFRDRQAALRVRNSAHWEARSTALAVLADYEAHMRANAAACGITLGGNGFVFSNTADGSEPWYPDSLSRSFQRLCKQEGLTGVRLHDLRHLVASQLLSAGVDVRTVAGRLGHRNAATTLNVFAHFLKQSDRAAADVMGRLIAGDPEEVNMNSM
jgi:integrase